jgi:hypothetical protein
MKKSNMATHFQFAGTFFPVEKTVVKHVGQQGHFQVRLAGAAEPIDFYFAPEHANAIFGYLKNRLCADGECQDWDESWEELKKPEPVPEKEKRGRKPIFKIGDNVCFFWKDENRWYQGQVVLFSLSKLYHITAERDTFISSFDNGKIVPCLAEPPSLAECLGKKVLVKRDNHFIFEANIDDWDNASVSRVIAILP